MTEEAATGEGRRDERADGGTTPAALAETLGFSTPAPGALGRDEAFAPQDESRAWLVTEGAVDLFVTLPRGDGRPGPRQHLARLGAGELIVGLPAPAGGSGRATGASVTAVPASSGRIAAGTLAALLATARDGALATTAAGLLEGWIARLTEAMALPPPPPEAVGLEAGSSASGEAEGLFLARRNTCWLAAPAADAQFASVGPLAGLGWSGHHLPLTPESWIVLERAADLKSLDTSAWLAQGTVAEDLAGYARLALSLLEAAAARQEEEVVARLARRETVQRERLSASVGSLTAVIEQRKPVAGVAAGEPLVAALEAAAGELGIALSLPKGGLAAVPKDQDPLLYLCARSAVQCRRVTLPEDWLHDDYGPLIGRYGPAGRPCALLPTAMGRYRLVDPAAGIDQDVTAALARQIEPVVHLLYKPLPEGKIDGRRLLDFSIPGNARDFAYIVGMVVLAGIASIVTPVAPGYIVSTIIPSAEIGQLLVLGLVVLASLLAAAVFNFVQSIAMLRIEGRLDQRVEAAVWDRLLKLRAPFFRQYTVGDLANRAQSIGQIRQLITGSVINSSIAGIMGLFSLGLMVVYDWLLGLLVGGVSLAYALIGYLIGRAIVGLNRKRMFLDGKVQGLLFQLLGAVEKLRVTGSEATAFGLWQRDFLKYAGFTNRQNGWTNLVKVMNGVFPFVAVVIVLAVIGWQSGQLDAFFDFSRSWQEIEAAAFSDIMTPGDFSAFITAYVQFTTAVIGLVGVAVQLTLVRPLLERVTPILQAEEENDSGKKDPGEIRG
ncbi:MAG: ABC transporter transmembrane domain-containing protein, partial [Tistlia sp.]